MYIQGMQPTCVESKSYLSVVADTFGKLTLKVFDTQGKIAKTIKTQIDQGFQMLDVNMTDLNEGSYVLNIFNDDIFLKAIRFVKA